MKTDTGKSLSARRAWIEIIDYIIDYVNDAVALRKESVDRNVFLTLTVRNVPVALRKESVDRNIQQVDDAFGTGGRSPQGDRG